jgi:hypothetical protein
MQFLLPLLWPGPELSLVYLLVVNLSCGSSALPTRLLAQQLGTVGAQHPC